MDRIDSNNFDTKIKDIITNCIPACTNIYFRVGYFYFSGFSLIAKTIKDKNIKILIGLETDQVTENLITKSKAEIQNDYFEKFLKFADKESNLENIDEQDAYFIFEKKLRDGSLEIRQQIKGNHAKEYLFEYDSKTAKITNSPGRTIGGSMNWSRSGLISQGETCYDIPDKNIFEEASKSFLDEWSSSNSVLLVNKDNFHKFKEKVKKLNFIQKPKPYLMFVRVLNEYFKDRDEGKIKFPKQITNGKYIDIKYQKDAITKAYEIVNEHNGALIADVVGLGKSIIASTVANNLDLQTFVICPPHLKTDWDDYLFEFKVNKKIFTTGKLNAALEEAEKFDGQKLIIIDEVHKFRNDETEDYSKLFQLCHGGNSGEPNKILLLSATPFNNHPKDTFSLIKLFQIPGRSTLQTVSNLSAYFENLTKNYNKLQSEQRDLEKNNGKKKRSVEEIDSDFSRMGEQIRKMLTPIMIRRSRIDLENIKVYWDDLLKLKMGIPKVRDPVILDYDLKNLEEIYKKTIKLISPISKENQYKCSRYKPLTYIKPEFMDEILTRGGYDNEERNKGLPKQQQNIADFMKRLIVRRFESSSHSFYKTLKKIILSSEIIINYYEKLNFIPVYKKGEIPDCEELFDYDTGDNIDWKMDSFETNNLDNIKFDDIENLPKMKELVSRGLWIIKKEELKERYIDDVKSDLEVLRGIKKEWEIVETNNFNDPKIFSFMERIKSQLKAEPKRKIIVFSEFADTVEFVYKNMIKKGFKVFSYTSKQASSKKIKDTIRDNFDAGRPDKKEYDILIATDAISEGFNLHRAGTIFNFDIPYNPTRVVQRFGRINRINKKVFDYLNIYNFFPTESGEKEINIGRITGLKKMMFNSIFGDDTRVLTKDEDLQSYFVDKFNEHFKENESPETYFENIIYNLRDYERETILEAESISKRVKCKRNKKDTKGGLIVFSKKGNIPRFEKNNENDLSDIDFLKMFEADKKEDHIDFERKYEKIYEEIKEKMFTQDLIIAPGKNKKKLIEKIEKLKENSKFNNYLSLLLKVVKDLDALTPFQTKLILTSSHKTFDKNIFEVEKNIPEKLLKSLINNYNEIKSKKESLIIAQQINDGF